MDPSLDIKSFWLFFWLTVQHKSYSNESVSSSSFIFTSKKKKQEVLFGQILNLLAQVWFISGLWSLDKTTLNLPI